MKSNMVDRSLIESCNLIDRSLINSRVSPRYKEETFLQKRYEQDK